MAEEVQSIIPTSSQDLAPSEGEQEELSEAAIEFMSLHHEEGEFFGRDWGVPVYHVVFGMLAVATIAEVLSAELFSSSGIRIPLLLGIGVFKAVLVALYYMHLNEDRRVFAISLLFPILVAGLSLLFLMATSPTGY